MGILEMDGEINNFILVWTLAAATMCYCHSIGNLIPHGGATRFTALFPAILLLLLLPLRLTSIHLGGPSSFFLGWLSTFKLILFAFSKGPLSSNPPLSLGHFIPLASLPIKFQNNPQTNHKFPKSPFSATKFFILVFLIIPLYGIKQHLHPKFVLFLYSVHMYIALEFLFAIASVFTRKILAVQMEPQFDEPYLCTSLQDFWGRRWNISVNRVLHPTVYEPVAIACGHVIGRKWAPLPAILATFAVSGMMHELIFYYVKRESRTWEAWEPSWDATCFFLIHGLCLAIEVGIKKKLRGRCQLPRAVSRLLTVVFIIYTSLWLFLPALVRCRIYEKGTGELTALTQFVKDYVYGASKFAHLNVTTT